MPSGGGYSQRLQYGPNGSLNPNYYESAFDQSMVDNLNQQEALAGNGNKLYKAGGYIYGYGDPNTGTASQQFSNNLTAYVAGGKIIPSQRTMTAAQSVGPAQFQTGNQVATQGQSTLQSSSPFTASAPAVPQSTQSQPQTKPSGFYFGNNGSAGFLAGTMGNNTPGQGSPFYQNQPSSLNSSDPSLGTFSQVTPQQQALINSPSRVASVPKPTNIVPQVNQ